MRKTLFLHEVKPPTSKTFNFFQCKGIIPFLLHPLFPDFLLQIITLFIVRYAFALPPLYLRSSFASKPFQIRCKSVPKNGRKMGLTRELQGNCERGIEIQFYVKIHKIEAPKRKKSINRRLFRRIYITL